MHRRNKMFTKFKKYMKVIAYIIFTLVELFYIRIIFALYNAIQITRDGGFVKSIDENNPVWYYRSEDNMILHDKILFGGFILFLIIPFIFIRRPKWAVFIQIVWLIFVVLEGCFIKSFTGII